MARRYVSGEKVEQPAPFTIHPQACFLLFQVCLQTGHLYSPTAFPPTTPHSQHRQTARDSIQPHAPPAPCTPYTRTTRAPSTYVYLHTSPKRYCVMFTFRHSNRHQVTAPVYEHNLLHKPLILPFPHSPVSESQTDI